MRNPSVELGNILVIKPVYIVFLFKKVQPDAQLGLERTRTAELIAANTKAASPYMKAAPQRESRDENQPAFSVILLTYETMAGNFSKGKFTIEYDAELSCSSKVITTAPVPYLLRVFL